MQLSNDLKKIVNGLQLDEATGAVLYKYLAKRAQKKNPENAEILTQMAEEEEAHYAFWQQYTGEVVKPNRRRILWYKILSFLFGYTFVIRLMERGEMLSADDYRTLADHIPEAAQMAKDEDLHEQALIANFVEERLQYVGAMVLGLNDALVELTGAIAGYTFAYTNTRMVALSGIIVGVAAAFSMAASNYLAEKAEGNENAFTSMIYTGIAYLATVVLLVLPYLLFGNDQYILALVVMLASVLIIIFVFNYYISIAKRFPFKKHFLEMAGISFGVAILSFGIGLLAKSLLGIDI